MATYGDFPGVRVETESGAISSVAIGAEEKLVIFGEASYNTSNEVEGDDSTLNVSASSPEQINAPRVADDKFGSDTELADAMKEALENGANINFLYGVAVPRVDRSETQTAQTGTLDNVELVDGDTSHVTWDDSGTAFTVEFRYNGAPSTPTGTEEVFINPLTGEYAASAAPSGSEFTVDYTYSDYSTAFGASGPQNVIEEDETGVWIALSDSDSVSSSLNTQVSNLRNNYALVNALSFAEPNDNDVTTDSSVGAFALYDTANYDTANQSITEEYYYKFAPARKENEVATIGGGVGGLFAGNGISDPIYNDELSGYQALQQQLTRTDADNMRAEDVIPIRSGGSIRVKGNRSTAYSSSNTIAAEFWSRRIADRVILIGKQIGDEIIGRINDEQSRNAAEREISAQLRKLAGQRLIRQNSSDETNWTVDVYEDETNSDEVNIDITFSPYGIVKRVDETVTVDTS